MKTKQTITKLIENRKNDFISRPASETNTQAFVTKSGSVIEVRLDRTADYPAKLTVDGNWFSVHDLRELSKLAKKLADALEADGAEVAEAA